MLEYILACIVLMIIACGFFLFPFARVFKNSQKETAYWQEQWKSLADKQQQREMLFVEGAITEQESVQLKQALTQDYLLRPVLKEQSGKEQSETQTQNKFVTHVFSRVSLFLTGLLALLFVLALVVDYLSGRSQQVFSWHESSRWMLPRVEAYLAGEEVVFEDDEGQSIDTLLFLRSLQLYLQRQSGDAHAWSVLGNILSAAEAHDLALMAYQRAYRAAYFRDYHASIPKDKYALNYVNARLSMKSGELDEESYQILQTVLEENPQHESALMLLGMAAYHSKHYVLAENSWSRLLVNLQSKTNVPQEVLDSLSRSIEAAKTASKEAEQHLRTEKDSKAAEKALSFDLLLTLDESLKTLLREGAVLFVFLRAPDSQGMPLAAVRKAMVSGQVFPVRLRIGSADVLAGQTLAGHQKLEVSVRISHSGQALAQKGDWESDKIILEMAQHTEVMEIRIDRVRD